jgi:carnosine N-methyltransferase
MAKAFPELAEKNEITLIEFISKYNIIDDKEFNKEYIQLGNNNKSDNDRPSFGYESVEQLLVHLNRDWGPDGIHVRQKLYQDSIIHALLLHSGDANGRNLSVLVPGAGLGRLGLEIASLGYR